MIAALYIYTLHPGKLFKTMTKNVSEIFYGLQSSAETKTMDISRRLWDRSYGKKKKLVEHHVPAFIGKG